MERIGERTDILAATKLADGQKADHSGDWGLDYRGHPAVHVARRGATRWSGGPREPVLLLDDEGHPNWTVLNRGVNGERSDQILSRFERDVVAVKPSIVIVLAGVNDIYQGLTSDSVKINLEAMYALAESKGIVPVAATVLPYNTARPKERNSIREVNAWIAKASKVPGRLFCDTNLAVREEGDPDFLDSSRDGLHPDVDGYRRMGAALSATLENAGY